MFIKDRFPLPAPTDNTTLALKPFGKQPTFIFLLSTVAPAVSPMKNVSCHCGQGKKGWLIKEPMNKRGWQEN